jgi:hypothetical protein
MTSSRSAATTQRSGGSQSGGGLLGGVSNTAGGVVNTTTSAVGGVASGATSAVGSTVHSTTSAAQTTAGVERSLGGIQINESSSTSAQGGSTLSLQRGNLRLEKDTTFNLVISQSATSAGARKSR